MNWIIENWLPLYLIFGIFGAAFAARDGNSEGVIFNGVVGLLWPLMLVAVVITVLMSASRR